MSRDWKPGDVYLAKYEGEAPKLFMRIKAFGKDQYEWKSSERTKSWDFGAAQWFRPLVVIDPEDREQVERLTDLMWARGLLGSGVGGRCTPAVEVTEAQAALREFANPTPPRMDEPAVWGVVEASCVHTDKRMKWMRHEDGNWWPFVNYNDGDERRPLPDDWDSLVEPKLIREGLS